jgi:hypothetical protein
MRSAIVAPYLRPCMSRRLVAFGLLIVLALSVAGAALARDPHDEQVRLRAADVALAKRIVLSQKDVGYAWKRESIVGDHANPKCPGFDPDFSAFTITGKAKTVYKQPSGATVASSVEVFRSRSDAVGDFRAGARPELALCIRTLLERELSGSGLPMRVVSSAVVAAPRVGERRIAYRTIARIDAAHVNVYLDWVIVQRGRSIFALTFMTPHKPPAARDQLAAKVASRLR